MEVDTIRGVYTGLVRLHTFTSSSALKELTGFYQPATPRGLCAKAGMTELNPEAARNDDFGFRVWGWGWKAQFETFTFLLKVWFRVHGSRNQSPATQRQGDSQGLNLRRRFPKPYNPITLNP